MGLFYVLPKDLGDDIGLVIIVLKDLGYDIVDYFLRGHVFRPLQSSFFIETLGPLIMSIPFAFTRFDLVRRIVRVGGKFSLSFAGNRFFQHFTVFVVVGFRVDALLGLLSGRTSFFF